MLTPPPGCHRAVKASQAGGRRSADTRERLVHAVIGQVRIKPDRADEALAMLRERGIAMLQGMPGSAGGYWARNLTGDLVQHSFWMFDTEESARAAELTFNQLRNLPDAPATFLSVEVCEIIGQA
jgi:hypothetical protein